MNAPLLKTLLSATRSLEDARRPAPDGGLPKAPGLYAWWCRPNAIPGVAGPWHPVEDFQLVYVGAAPTRPRSSASVRTTVLTNHVSGNVASSAFRLCLASLLRESERLEPHRRGSRVVLSAADNRRLGEWQAAQMRLTWCKREHPFAIEGDVVRLMRPPLNLAENEEDPLHGVVAGARRAFLDG